MWMNTVHTENETRFSKWKSAPHCGVRSGAAKVNFQPCDTSTVLLWTMDVSEEGYFKGDVHSAHDCCCITPPDLVLATALL